LLFGQIPFLPNTPVDGALMIQYMRLTGPELCTFPCMSSVGRVKAKCLDGFVSKESFQTLCDVNEEEKRGFDI
jgi:hypothetical protein